MKRLPFAIAGTLNLRSLAGCAGLHPEMNHKVVLDTAPIEKAAQERDELFGREQAEMIATMAEAQLDQPAS